MALYRYPMAPQFRGSPPGDMASHWDMRVDAASEKRRALWERGACVREGRGLEGGGAFPPGAEGQTTGERGNNP